MTERVQERFADPFEAWLAAGLATDPAPAIVERLDKRVRAAMSAPVPLARRRLRFGRRSRGLLLIAAAVAIMGAAAGALGLFAWLVPSEASWQVAWDRGASFHLTSSTTAADVTLERAYGDANAVVVFLVADDPSGTANLLATDVSLIDSDGRTYDPQAEFGDPTTGLVEHVDAFSTPEPWLSGERSFTLSVGKVTITGIGQKRTIAGPWTLQFSIGSAGGSIGAPGAPVSIGGATVELRSVVVSPTMIRGELLVTDAPALPKEFAPIATVDVGGHRLQVRYSIGPDGHGIPGLSRFGTFEGVDAVLGEGTVEVTELVGFDPDPNVPQVRLQGPWRLTFDVR